MLRVGTVTEVRSGMARVRTGKMTTDWRPYLTLRAGSSKTAWRISVGEQVLLLSLSGDLANAFILPAINSLDNPDPNDHPTADHTAYPDGAVIEYDPATGSLTANGIKTAVIQASISVLVDCPETEATGNLHVGGNLTIAGAAVVQGPFAAQASATVTGGASVDGIEFADHAHDGVRSGSDISGAVA